MTRPAVIIGLGGTGQWVSTYAKKELIEDNNGEMPNNVQILAFDTWPDENVAGGGRTGNDLNNIISVGNVALKKGDEFVPLSGDVYPVAENVVRDSNQYGYIGKRISDTSDAFAWFDAPYLMNAVPRPTWNLNIGAGQIRQFGRMAFFHHASIIRSRLLTAFSQVNPGTVQDNNSDIPVADAVQIIIVASLAGGTGAGMFLDMAVMARDVAISVFGKQGAFIRGIFVFPAAFNMRDTTKLEMEGRAYAAWREMARFMNLGPLFGAHEIQYDLNTSVKVNAKPFDQVFLIDSKRPAHSFVGQHPEDGVFPSIATFISTTLDDENGKDLGMAINNINGTFGGKLGFSTFGAYSIQLPISHVVEEYALQLGRDLLIRWLEPILSADQTANGIANNKNNENPGRTGSAESSTFMNAQKIDSSAIINRADPTITNPTDSLFNLPLLSKLADYYSNSTVGNTKIDIERDVQGNFGILDPEGNIDSDTWLKRILLTADSTKTQIFGKDGNLHPINPNVIAQEVASTVRGKIQTSKELGQNPGDTESQRLIKEVESQNNGFIGSHYGNATQTGSFDRSVDDLVEFHSRRYRQLMKIQLMNLLNGKSIAPGLGLGGKLGYTEDFLRNLIHVYEWFLNTHLSEVKTRRGATPSTVDGLAPYRQAMLEHQDDKILLYVGPKAHSTQEEYLDIAQLHCDRLKDDKVLQAVGEITKSFLDSTKLLLHQIENWKKTFITGDTNSQGLYRQEISRIGQVQQDLDKLANENKAQHLQKIRDYPSNFNQDANLLGAIDEQLKKITWKVDTNVDLLGPVSISCEINNGGGNISAFTQFDNSKENIEELSRLGQAASKLYGVRKGLLELMQDPNSRYYQPAEDVGRELMEKSQPLYEPIGGGGGGSIIKSAFRRANSSAINGVSPANYLAAIDAQKGLIAPQLYGGGQYKTSDSTNSYKISLIQWVDRLGIRDFKVYEEFKASYYKMVRGGDYKETASRLHIFPAEANAAFYESLLPIWMNQPIREFSPRVVLLLTHIERVRWFFQAYALGFIVHGNYTNARFGQWWRLVIPDKNGQKGQNICFYSSDRATDPDIFDLINSFCIGRDVITQSQIIFPASAQLGIRSVRTAISETLNPSNKELGNNIDAQYELPNSVLTEVDYKCEPDEMMNPRLRMISYLNSNGVSAMNTYIATNGQPPTSNPGWDWITVHDYSDIATLAKMMYIETLLTARQLILTDTTKLGIYR